MPLILNYKCHLGQYMSAFQGQKHDQSALLPAMPATCFPGLAFVPGSGKKWVGRRQSWWNEQGSVTCKKRSEMERSQLTLGGAALSPRSPLEKQGCFLTEWFSITPYCILCNSNIFQFCLNSQLLVLIEANFAYHLVKVTTHYCFNAFNMALKSHSYA